MRIARFKAKDNQVNYGVVHDDSISIIDGNILGQWKETSRKVKLNEVSLLAPIDPPNILCIGLNYKANSEECGDNLPKKPLLFIKATTALNHPNAPVVLPKIAPNEVDYEAELVAVIGKTARNVSEIDALNHVLGYTCANDISARDCQGGDGQWARGKSFDSFCPIGPWIETELDPTNRPIQMRLNGQTLQDANTSLMIFSVAYLISYLSQALTLLPGTILLTGTPSGVGFARNPKIFIKSGDKLEVDIEGIGVLKNTVKSE